MFPRLFWWYRDTIMAEAVAALGFEVVSARYQQAILLIPADTNVIPICRSRTASLWHNWYQDGISAVSSRYHRWYRVGSCQVGPHVWVRAESDAGIDVAESTGGLHALYRARHHVQWQYNTGLFGMIRLLSIGPFLFARARRGLNTGAGGRQTHPHGRLFFTRRIVPHCSF